MKMLEGRLHMLSENKTALDQQRKRLEENRKAERHNVKHQESRGRGKKTR
jgi:hypothetical protein